MTATIGVDLGGTNTRVVRLDGDIDDMVVERGRDRGVDIVDHVTPLVEDLWTDDVAAVGVGIAGLVAWPGGVFRWGPHVSGVEVPVQAMLENRLGVPVAVDNDANAALAAEAQRGAAAGVDNAVLVNLGTGIGGAILSGGAIHRGASFAGEFGHLTMRDDGEPCDCGRRGCWETLVSGPALERLAIGSSDPDLAEAATAVGAPAVVAAAVAGNQVAESLVLKMGEDLGRGVTWLVTALDPEIVVVGGGFGAVGDLLLEPARRIVATHLHGVGHRVAPPIVTSELGELSGAVGAALLAADKVGAP